MNGTPEPRHTPISSKPSWRPREQQALEELGVTRFARGVPWTLIALFLSILFAVPIYETLSDWRSLSVPAADGATGRKHLTLLYLWPGRSELFAAKSLAAWRRIIPNSYALRAFEDEMLLKSAVGKQIRPWLQWMLVKALGTGSQKVVIGRDGFLYYSDGIEYVSGGAFLDSARLARRAEAKHESDPRPAIIQLHQALQAIGVTLIVVPIPDKAVIRPTALLSHGEASVPAQNPSWATFAHDLTAQHVRVVDLTDEMFAADRSGEVQFLRGDSHWSPAAIELAAKTVSRTIDSIDRGTRSARYRRQSVSADRKVDLVSLLDLPNAKREAFGQHETVRLNQVVDSLGLAWQPDPKSDVLFVGDSFLEMFSTDTTEARSSGLAEQVSYVSSRRVDRVASHQVDVRRLLGSTLAEVRTAARGRKVIVWEFAMRKLAVSDWPLLH